MVIKGNQMGGMLFKACVPVNNAAADCYTGATGPYITTCNNARHWHCNCKDQYGDCMNSSICECIDGYHDGTLNFVIDSQCT